jgi:hypothetical protein
MEGSSLALRGHIVMRRVRALIARQDMLIDEVCLLDQRFLQVGERLAHVLVDPGVYVGGIGRRAMAAAL